MAAKIHEFKGTDHSVWVFDCPGCKIGHGFKVPGWTWNGDVEKPTFSPSLLVNGSWPEKRCHSFVRDGRIEFLSDCFHALAGQTVDLPDYSDEPLPEGQP